ncbi:hypothetical protein SYNPS1DRAFT_23758 [Syncephalis pseudoplumigaleata]|uniref:Ribosomal eL28/Mak16 domain-containing protein n=1 Tax=Syncephalis pseudoplumigaleata TaxID=1712513 RepID=A0A4V1J182_9FUNG|nr:hypothetical protein SYNPS1DRAFT_23758 [Syncephalis pseudoplumigaleata]|eukprot:RKP24149.1 hypothetical protein SYNPS1DRAFT_23758 [Syncephalis pseudoplumigaleata]
MTTSALTWLLLKKQSRFVVKRAGAEFNTEPGNLTNKNTFTSSSLVNKSVVLAAGPKGKGVKLTQPSGRVVKLTRGAARAARTVSGAVRPQQRRVALARMSAILRAQRPVKATTFKRTGIRATRK